MSVRDSGRSYRANRNPTPGDSLPSLTQYSECLERLRSVLVFFGATGRANAAVLAELESEVRATSIAARLGAVSLEEVEADLERIAANTLPEGPAANASRMMKRWLAMAVERPSGSGPVPGSDELRA